MKKSQSELISYLFGTGYSPIAEPLAGWIAGSTRYASFVEQYKDKIRKKLRVTQDEGATADLLFELQIPCWLLQERRFEVAYEPFAAEKKRGPDFAVTFRTHTTFNIEATRLHGRSRTPASNQAGQTAIDFHLVDVLCSKLRQMLANQANLLVIGAAAADNGTLDLPAHIAWIKTKAESGDLQFFARHRYRGTTDFFKFYARLSGILAAHPGEALRGELWLNPQARVRLADPVRAILQKGFAREEPSP